MSAYSKPLKSVSEIPKTDSPGEIKLNKNMYREAVEEYGLTFSEYLEHMNPSKPNDKLTAFERQLARYDIKTQSDPKRGIYAGSLHQFFVTDSDATILFPEFINNMARWEMLVPEDDPYDINLITGGQELGLSSNIFQEMYVDDSEDDYQESVTNEMAGFPEFTITWSQKAEGMKKYGIALKWSYEFMRRARIDIIRPVIQRFAQMQKRAIFREGLYFLINGTGTDMTPAASSSTMATYDTSISAAGEVSYKGWLFWLNAMRPYQIDTVFMRMSTAYALLTMTRPNVNELALREALDPKLVNAPVLIRGIRANPVMVIVDDAHISANTIVGIDSKYAARRMFEIGADLVETERIITQQFERIVLSNYSGFSKIFPKATHVLTLTV